MTGSTFESSISVLPASVIKAGIIPEEKYFVVFPGGSFAAKMWTPERFAKVAEVIYQKTGWKCCITGTASEKPLAERFDGENDFIRIYRGN